ncbi:hypothetical protein [Chitinophaga sp. YR627]|uniref:hypothetical protein n=1 Tax=Chitinophaga sp. YR627 TaxID=1881041 RepID=UPI000B7DA5A0|nr:hypothetical protein [Chitinophaga sp. YR627]
MTLFLSFVLSGFFFLIYYSASNPGFEQGQGLFIIFGVAEIFQHLFLFLSALPALSVGKQINFTDKAGKLVRYFGGPVAFTILSILIIIKADWFDELLLLLIPNFTFLILHILFYIKLPKEFSE